MEGKVEKFMDFLLTENPSLPDVLKMLTFLSHWVEYKATMREAISDPMIKKTKEYMQFKRIMRGV